MTRIGKELAQPYSERSLTEISDWAKTASAMLRRYASSDSYSSAERLDHASDAGRFEALSKAIADVLALANVKERV